VSALLFVLRAESKPQSYFYSPVNDLWMGDITTGIMSFMLTWTLFYGIVRAQ
jgi:ER membrane protein complex subunit 6